MVGDDIKIALDVPAREGVKRPSTVDRGPSTVDRRLSTVHRRLSAARPAPATYAQAVSLKPSSPAVRYVLTRMPPSAVPANWADLPDEQLLDLRLSDLPLRSRSTVLQRIAELARRARRARSPLSDPLLSLGRVVHSGRPGGHGRAVLLAHPRLERLERSRRCSRSRAAEHDWCMRILRHEAGHVVDNVYKLRLRRQRRAALRPVLGAVSRVLRSQAVQQELRAAHRALVRAESSRRGLCRNVRAVADANANWKQRYAGWPALKKLEYMDALMKSLRGRNRS